MPKNLVTCSLSGESFEVSEAEVSLRTKLGIEGLPTTAPWVRFRALGAFWQHWNLHRRTCDKTGKNLISVFRPDAPYPVWHKDEWVAHAHPPSAEFDFKQPFFSQAWALFKQSPIPHNFQNKNENCEYTDDWYQSKNCYMCHGGQSCEDCRYCYGCDGLKDCYWCFLSFDSVNSADLMACKLCQESLYLLSCREVHDSAFCYDCRNCTDCLFCFNQRNKQYCFGNKQLTKEAFFKKKAEWDFSTAEKYEKAQKFFAEIMQNLAWHRAALVDRSDNSHGNLINHCKDTHNAFMLSKHEESINNVFSGPHSKSTLDSLGTVGAELTFQCVLPVYSYQVRNCFSVSGSKFCDYSAFLLNCENCFGCCGLVGKKYHIFNKPYTPNEYETLKAKIIEHMEQSGEWGSFFPGYFAPAPYDESFSGFYFPLTKAKQDENGVWFAAPIPSQKANSNPVPTNWDSVKSNDIYWDEVACKPFVIDADEVAFCQKLGLPPNRAHYISRIQKHIRYFHWDGKMRETKCVKSGKSIETNWPSEYDHRIVCEEEYLKILHG